MTRDVKQKNNVRNRLTVPDLILLSLLAERPMHGYEINLTLEDRNIREWAPVSRPQIYYSLEKLTALGLLRVVKDEGPAAGPERRVVSTTAKGRNRLAEALEAEHWVNDRVYQPFLIWLALSWQARGNTFSDQLKGRKGFLLARLGEQRTALEEVLREVGHRHHEAVWMLELVIGQTELELTWIGNIQDDATLRAPARNRSSRITTDFPIESDKNIS
jgi:DNA-binding PadR family transcriptional regulator